MAIRRERGHSLHIVDFLVENATNLDATTVDGHTAVHYCALYNQPECLKLLLRSGANVSAETKDKKTAIELAKDYGSTACEELVTTQESYPLTYYSLYSTLYFCVGLFSCRFHLLEHR